jgi:putative colanic acid biosynthesis acetyltransferase WcaF
MSFGQYRSEWSFSHRVRRACWDIVWALFFRTTPRLPGFWAWRRALLRLFGAELGRGVLVYPSARIWAPWNLEAGDHSMIGPSTDIYSVDKIVLGARAWISQYSFLCTASHSITDPRSRLLRRPIHIGADAWVAAGAFVGLGVNVGAGAVVAARACVVKDVKPWTVVGGNPAKFLKRRTWRQEPGS